MELQHLRGWAEFADKATVVALAVAVVALIAAGTSSWLSFSYNRTLRLQESSVLDRATGHAAEVDREVEALRDRSARLEKALADVTEQAGEARRHIVEIERSIEAATAKTAGLEAEVAAEKAARATPATAPVVEKAPEKVVEKAPEPAAAEPPVAEKPADKPVDAAPAPAPAAVAAAPAPPALKPVAPVWLAALQKFTGTKVAVYVIADAADAAEAGSSIVGMLSEAGWSSATWKWAGVSGIVGVIVLTKDGVDPAADTAATATAEILRAAGFNAVKGSWPQDADWRRFQGTLSGPQSPDPTEARIRLVIGARPKA